MEQTNRLFEVEYHDPSLRDGTYDVTFTLSEDAEDALFAAFDREISDYVRDGILPDQKLHLLRKLSEQRDNHPPWIEVDADERTYDLELSEWDYHILTTIVGESLSNVLGPEGASRYEELVEIWTEITEQMRIDQEIDEVIDEAAEELRDDEFDYESARFECFTADRNFSVFTNDNVKWYHCLDCKTDVWDRGDHNECPER